MTGPEIDWEAVVSRLGLALAALAAIGGAVRGMFRLFGRMQHFLDDWFGEEARDGVPARPGVMERLDSLEQAIRESDGP